MNEKETVIENEEKVIRMDLSDVGYPSVYTVSNKGQGYVALQLILIRLSGRMKQEKYLISVKDMKFQMITKYILFT